MSNIYAWDVVAANNANADASIDWAEGMSPANVNDSARVMMARVKEFLIDLGGSITATGTANVLAVTSQSAFTTLANGRVVSFRAFATNTQATTLNVNAIGAKPVLKATSSGIVALTGNEIQNTGIYTVQYSAALNSGNGAWLLTNPTLAAVPPGVRVGYCGTNAPAGWLLCYGQAISRTEYADLFAAIGTQFGTGDGSTTFNLPDYRGRTGAGKDNMGGTTAGRLGSATHGITGTTLGSAGGSEVVTLTASQLPSNIPNSLGGLTVSGTVLTPVVTGFSVAFAGGNTVNGYTYNSQLTSPSISGTVGGTLSINPSGGQAVSNVQPTIVENMIIKA